ncbi:MAG: hypothetical protein GX354_05390 [Firmicutes bacterium]|nr:hypothetical protein [Bacillota bacterium]
MGYGRSKADKILLVMLAIGMAGLSSYCLDHGTNTARAAQYDTMPLAEGSVDDPILGLSSKLDPLDLEPQERLPLGLELHGTKVLELQYLTITGQPKPPHLSIPPPGLIFSQKLEANIEGIWPGIWVRGSFDDDPFFPKYLLQVDMPNATITLGDTNIKSLSSPLSPLDLPLDGAQGTLDLGDFTFSLVAGHTQTLTQVETFALHPTAGVYQMRLAPILAGTELLQIGKTILVPQQDYQIDYDLGQVRLMGFWPEAREFVISYQVADHSLGKKPLVQGFRGEYQAKYGTIGLTHMARSEPDAKSGDSDRYPLPHGDGLSSKAQLTWSTLSWEQGLGSISPHLAAEVWRRTQRPTVLSSRVVEDMESQPFRHPLIPEISDPTKWSRPNVTSGTALRLTKKSGYMPIEGVTRSALGLDFTLAGTQATAETRLILPTPLNLVAENTLILTLGLAEPLPGINLEIGLISGTSGSFRQSIPLGSLVGWQDLVLAPEAWTKTGIPTWERITALEITLTSLLPGTLEGQLVLAALDATGVNQAPQRWQSLRPRDYAVDIKSIPVPTAPWLPPPSNMALSITVEKLKGSSTIPSPNEPRKGNDPEEPQVWGLIPRPFTPTEAKTLTFWAYAPEPGMGLTIWLVDLRGKVTNPFSFQLSAGWHEYEIALDKLATYHLGEVITSIVLAITPSPGRSSATLLLDEWQLSDMQFTEGYMARFAASKEDNLVHWRLTGSGQTEGFRWDAPGMQPGVPHPNHLAFDATLYRPGNKHIGFSILQAGMTDGETHLEFEADTWDRTMVDGQLTLPNGTSSPVTDSSPAPATGHLRLRTTLDQSTWELSVFRQLQASPLLQTREFYPQEAQTIQGLALSVQQHLTPGVMRFGTWHLAEGANGQNLSADLYWHLINSLPVSATCNIQRYQPSPGVPGELGGSSLLETTWQNPEGNWSLTASLDQRLGRRKRSLPTQPGLWPWGNELSLENQPPWESWGDSPRLWQQETILGWQWQPNELVTLKARWQREATRRLDSEQGFLESVGNLSVSWPVGQHFRYQGRINHSQRQDANNQTIQSTEYSLASEGTWHEDWSLGFGASQKQTRWQETNHVSPALHGGERWLIKGYTDYAYRPQGSIGLSGTLSHQTISTPDLGGYSESNSDGSWVFGSDGPWHTGTESGESTTGEPWTQSLIGEPWAFSSMALWAPRVSGAPGTYLDTRIRWALAQAAFYQMSLGTVIYSPLASESSQVDHYGQASIEKAWGALGTGRLELSAGLGSQTTWAIGLGWTKQLVKGEKGLYLKAGMRHVKQPQYQLTDTRLALEYRF